MQPIKFLDDGKRTKAARRRVRNWWIQRCPPDVQIWVIPTQLYNVFGSRGLPPGLRSIGQAHIPNKTEADKVATIIVPTESLRRRDWQTTLEHELLHIQHPDWDEDQVIARAKVLAERWCLDRLLMR